MQKLRAEVSKLGSKGNTIDRTDLRNMPYLQNVIKESKFGVVSPDLKVLLTPTALRLYPSLPVNTRTAVRTTILPTGGGPDRKSPVLIPEGTAVAYSVYTLHRRPDLYGMDAELFRPERWDEYMPMKHDPTSHQWGYLPFNGGPRICLGCKLNTQVILHPSPSLLTNIYLVDFALTEAAYTIVRIMQKYPNIKLPKGEPVELTGVEKQTVTLVLQIKDGCQVELS